MRFLRLTVPLLVLGLGACNSGSGGSIAVAWRFDGSSCTNAGIEQVRIAIAGETLNPDTFDCTSGVVSFDNFFNGTYAVVVQGLNAITGEALWSGTGTAVVHDGDTAVTVVMEPQSPDNTVAYLSWTFDPATGQFPQCGMGQRLDSVGIFIDNQDSNLVWSTTAATGPTPASRRRPISPPATTPSSWWPSTPPTTRSPSPRATR